MVISKINGYNTNLKGFISQQEKMNKEEVLKKQQNDLR